VVSVGRPGPHRHRRGAGKRPAILPDNPGQTRTGCRALNEPDVDELVGSFGADLRRLRFEAGEPAFRSLAHTTGYGRTTLHDALKGDRLPALDVTLGLVRALRGNEDEWRARWVAARAALDARRSPAPAATPNGDVSDRQNADGRRADRGGPELDGGRKSPGRRPKGRKSLIAAIAGALLIAVAVLVVNLLTRDDPSRLIRDRCEHVRQYRITTSGNVLSSGGEVVGTVVAGDMFKAQRTNGLPYFKHRYYGTVLRTGAWGYVDQSKLQFSANTCL
jgi:hypothetical protein